VRFSRSFLFLLVAALIGLIAPFSPLLNGQSASNQAPTNQPRFDAISVKVSNSTELRGGLQFQPGGRLVATNIPVRPLFSLAYNIALSQGRGAIVGAPSWFESKRYDIEAKASGDPSREQMILMLQSLLADRFKLVLHHESRQQPIYALVVVKPGKTGPGLKVHSDETPCISAPQPDPGPGNPLPAYCGSFRVGAAASGGLRETGNAISLRDLASTFSQQVDRPVVDRTGLGGVFDVDVEFISQRALTDAHPNSDTTDPDAAAPPSIFTAAQQQLGLKLQATTGPVDVFVIDHIEEPMPN
jgi:uncharacterized protein (TIGR03435 family)